MSDLSESAGDAARRQLTLLLRAAITRGDYADRLPPDDEIAASYGVSRSVVRDALAALSDMGVLSRTRGHGTLPGDARPAAFNLLSMPADGGIPEYRLQPRVLGIETVDTSELVAARLPNAGAQVLRVEYVSVPDEHADGVSTCYFVLPKAEPLRTADFGQNIYTFISAGGLGVSGSDFVIGAMEADRFTALRLRTNPMSALLLLEQTIYDDAGDPLAYSTIALRGDRLAIISRASADAAGALRSD